MKHIDLKRCCFLLFGLFISFLSITGQKRDLVFEQLIPQEDFKQNYFISLFQDKKGFLWFGTYSALYRYDGYKLKSFTPSNDTNTISNPAVHCIFQDEDEKIWLGTEGGINIYNPVHDNFSRKFTIFTKPALSHNHVKAICKDEEGNFWIGTYGGGINVYNPSTGILKIYRNNPDKPACLPSDRINTIVRDNAGTIWIGTELGGLCAYNKSSDNFTVYKKDENNPFSISDNIVSTIYEDSRNRLWIGTWNGGLNLFNRDKKQFTSFIKKENNKNITIRAISEDNKGNLWIGSFGNGLYYFDVTNNNFSNYKQDELKENSVSSDYIWTLLYDKSNILWIGTAGNGLNKYDINRNQIPVYKITDRKRPASSIFEDSKHNLWIGSNKGLFAKYNRATNTYTNYLQGKLISEITSIVEDKSGSLWLGTTSDGLIRFNPGNNSFKAYRNFSNTQLSLTITALRIDQKGNIWFALYDGGLYRIDAAELQNKKSDFHFSVYRSNPDDFSTISSNIIWSIFEDLHSNIWLTTDKFIDKLDETSGKFKHFGGYSYSCIYQNKPGYLWIGTYGKGMIQFTMSDQKFEFYDKQKGISNNLINGIIGDNNGNLWISTFSGISKFNPLTKRFINYNISDGLQGEKFLHNSCTQLSTGELAFGGSEGFNIFNPDQLKSELNNLPVIISDFKLFNKSLYNDSAKYLQTIGKYELNETPAIKLKHSDNVFTIEFAALNFSNPSKQSYIYQLEGFDKDWLQTDAQNRLATYTNLDDGTYYFKVKTLNQDKSQSDKETRLKIIIRPPFFKTWIFKIFIIALLAFLGYIFYRRRIKFLNDRYLKIQLQNEQELIKLKNEKLDTELEFKSRELASRTMNLIHTNEKIKEIRNLIQNTIPKTTGEAHTNLNSILRSLDNEIEDDSYWDQFEFHFNQTHDNFLKRFKETYPALTHNDLKMCAYMRMNLQNHEIASLLNISIRSVETNRYRIRKKIKLDSPVSLTEYILRF